MEHSNGAVKTAFDQQVDGKRGPGRPKVTWKQRGIAESESSRLSTLMIDIPGDLMCDLPCVQQASYLEGGPLVLMLPLYLHVNQKFYYDIYMSSPGALLQVSLCHGLLSVIRPLLAFHIFYISSRTISWIELKLSWRHYGNMVIQNC